MKVGTVVCFSPFLSPRFAPTGLGEGGGEWEGGVEYILKIHRLYIHYRMYADAFLQRLSLTHSLPCTFSSGLFVKSAPVSAESHFSALFLK